MSFRWTKHDQRSLNITEASDYNEEVNNYVGVLNGGLDRDNLPLLSVDPTRLAVGATQQFSVDKPIRLDASMEPDYTVLLQYSGTNFNEYTSGWHVHQDDYIEEDFIEGHLWLIFNGWVWQFLERANGVGPPAVGYRVYAQFRLLFNGGVVYETGRIFMSPQQLHMETVIPVPSGPGKIEIAWSMVNATGLEPSPSARLLNFGGGKLVAINRYR